MRWKKIEILPFSIHNAFGYTSPPASQEPLLKEKPFKCGANIDGSSVERKMLNLDNPRLKVFGATFFQKGSKKT